MFERIDTTDSKLGEMIGSGSRRSRLASMGTPVYEMLLNEPPEKVLVQPLIGMTFTAGLAAMIDHHDSQPRTP
jgi:hypothetical protein